MMGTNSAAPVSTGYSAGMERASATSPLTEYSSKKEVNSGFMKFINFLRNLERQWESMPRSVQNRMAHTVADFYRNFLRDGVGAENRPLTWLLEQKIDGIGTGQPRGVHAPLEGLADHVIVLETSLKDRARPAVVTFEPGWTMKAYLQDRGYAIQVTDAMRNALFSEAEAIGGVSRSKFLDKGVKQPVWIVPARPHLWFFRSAQLDRLMEIISIAYVQRSIDIAEGKRPRPIPDISGGRARPARSRWTGGDQAVSYRDELGVPEGDE